MKFEVLVIGGVLRAMPYVMAPYSTVSMLYDENAKILIDPGSFVTWEALEKKLSEMKLPTDEVTDIILTHVHMDHIFSSIFFKHATFHVHEKYAERDYSSFGNLSGQLYSMVVSSWKNVQRLKGSERLFDCIDVFYTPYHSSDHISLVIETQNMGRILMPGDICYTKVEYYEAVKGYKNDEAARFVRETSKKCDWVIFTHDEPLRISR
ncbi:MBL fold metallo-hydrolase [Pseudothermotoga sp. U03pept]|uniref:MBL fold metallo-hydrolase n=1 Tax=Pseudothermotoga sp. U03pept TaxID=3447012 RepID=UPI003EFC6A61